MHASLAGMNDNPVFKAGIGSVMITFLGDGLFFEVCFQMTTRK